MTEVTVSPGLSLTLKALEKLDVKDVHPAGVFPLYDGAWHFLRSETGIGSGVENIADPVMVEHTRRSVAAALSSTDTVNQLKKMGYSSAQKILTTIIKTREDVIRWAESIYNVGPVNPRELYFPKHVVDAGDLALGSSFNPWIVDPEYGVMAVTAMSPLGNGDARVKVLYADSGSQWAKDLAKGKEIVLGPRHQISKSAFNGSTLLGKAVAAPKAVKASKAPATKKKAAAPSDGTVRAVGRPRLDGLVVGSEAVDILKDAILQKVPAPGWVFKMMNEVGQRKENERRNRLIAGPSKRGRKPGQKNAPKVAKVIPINSAAAPKRKFIKS